MAKASKRIKNQFSAFASSKEIPYVLSTHQHFTCAIISMNSFVKIEFFEIPQASRNCGKAFLHFTHFTLNFIFSFSLCLTQFVDAEQSYRSDCETDDGISVANYNEYLNGSSAQQQPTSRRKTRSPLTMRQGPQLSNEINNRRLQQYNASQDRLRSGK